MNYSFHYDRRSLNTSPDFVRLVDRICACVREREARLYGVQLPTKAKDANKEQSPRPKTYSTVHYVEHLKRSINDNPSAGQALFRFYTAVKAFTAQNSVIGGFGSRFNSTMTFGGVNESKISLSEKNSLDNLSSASSKLERNSFMSKASLITSQSADFIRHRPSSRFPQTRSASHTRPSTAATRHGGGLLTKATLAAIKKAPHQRSAHDIAALEQVLNRCESLRHLPAGVRHFAARSLLLLRYHSNTILTRQDSPSLIVYMIVDGQCKLLLETNRTTLFSRQLNIGDMYGDDYLQSIIGRRLNGLVTSETNSCNLIAFFPRDIKAYEQYLCDMMKRSLLEQLRTQSTFVAIQWRNDILTYFLQWTTYKQYSIDEIIYGNEEFEHDNLYFILRGQVSFVRLLELQSILLEHPELSQFYDKSDYRQRATSYRNSNIPRIKSTLGTKQRRSVSFNIAMPPNVDDSTSSRASNMEKNNDVETIFDHLPVVDIENSIPQRNMNALDARSSQEDKDPIVNRRKRKTVWRLLEVFVLSNGHYFGFELTTFHAWYLARTTVDIVSIPKHRFEELGHFAAMIFEKIRRDFLDIHPDETTTRKFYIKHLRTNQMSESNGDSTDLSTIRFGRKKRANQSKDEVEIGQKFNWIPEQSVLGQYKENLHLLNTSYCGAIASPYVQHSHLLNLLKHRD